jgi:hypothetical protein
MGIMTAPVVGSGSWPAWMQRVAKSSRFDLVIQASRTTVIMRVCEGTGKQDIVRLRSDRALAW